MTDEIDDRRRRLTGMIGTAWPDHDESNIGSDSGPIVKIYGPIHITVRGNGNTIFGVSSGAAPNETPKRPR